MKETYRKVKLGLLWELPRQMMGDLLAYVVSYLNIRQTPALGENMCPRVLLIGITVDYKLTYAFSNYVEAYEGTINMAVARSAACIALCPARNTTGAWVLWKNETKSKLRRGNLVKLVTMNC
jgi:hypothetical protein